MYAVSVVANPGKTINSTACTFNDTTGKSETAHIKFHNPKNSVIQVKTIVVE